MKVIAIEKAGYVWHVNLHDVADHRAKYYAEKDKDTTYQAEYDFVMEDDYEGVDWFQNNMNWDDIPEDAKEMVERPFVRQPDDIGWDDDCEYKIVEKVA